MPEYQTSRYEAKHAFDFIHSLLNLGIYPGMQRLDLIRVRILNQLVLISVICSLIILFQEILEQDWVGLLIISSFVSLGIGLLFLNSRRLFRQAALSQNILYPSCIFALNILYQGEDYLATTYLVFVFTAILFIAGYG